MAEAQSALGRYLLTKRLERSGESIPEYLAEFSATGSSGVISESYYRDIESGRKYIRPQTADRLREQLNLDARAFYYCLLQDLIPSDVFDELISPAAVQTYRSAGERIEKLERRIKQSSRAILNSLTDNITELHEDEINALQSDEALLGVIHFIYNRDSVTFEEVDRVYSRCGGAGHISDKIPSLFHDNTIYVDQKERRMFRRSKSIRIPRTEHGRVFREEFVRHEIRKSLKATSISSLEDGPGTLCYNTIVPISRQAYEEIELDGVGRLMSLVRSADKTLENDDVKPFFVSVILSTREEYDIDHQTKKGKRNGSIISH